MSWTVQPDGGFRRVARAVQSTAADSEMHVERRIARYTIARPLEGKRIVLIGEPRAMSASEAGRELRRLGALVTGRVSRRSELVIRCEAPRLGTSGRADALGVPTVGEDGLRRLLEGVSLSQLVALPRVVVKPPVDRSTSRDASLFTRLRQLDVEGRSERMVTEIALRVRPPRRAAWIWEAYGRGELPRRRVLTDMVARYVDRAPIDVVSGVLSAPDDGPQMLPQVSARAFWLLLTCCTEGNGDYLAGNVHRFSRPLQHAIWCVLGGTSRTRVPTEIVVCCWTNERGASLTRLATTTTARSPRSRQITANTGS